MKAFKSGITFGLVLTGIALSRPAAAMEKCFTQVLDLMNEDENSWLYAAPGSRQWYEDAIHRQPEGVRDDLKALLILNRNYTSATSLTLLQDMLYRMKADAPLIREALVRRIVRAVTDPAEMNGKDFELLVEAMGTVEDWKPTLDTLRARLFGAEDANRSFDRVFKLVTDGVVNKNVFAFLQEVEGWVARYKKQPSLKPAEEHILYAYLHILSEFAFFSPTSFSLIEEIGTIPETKHAAEFAISETKKHWPYEWSRPAFYPLALQNLPAGLSKQAFYDARDAINVNIEFKQDASGELKALGGQKISVEALFDEVRRRHATP